MPFKKIKHNITANQPTTSAVSNAAPQLLSPEYASLNLLPDNTSTKQHRKSLKNVRLSTIVIILLPIMCTAIIIAVVSYTKKPVQAPTQSTLQVTTQTTAPKKVSVSTQPTNTTTGQIPTSSTPVLSNSTSFNTIPINTSKNGAKYYYAGGQQMASASGASVDLTQEQPSVSQTMGGGNHSLMELSVESSDDNQIVEVGWIVDQQQIGDSQPHLFVYHWVNGQGSCYNYCGFVRSSTTNYPGESVPVGQTGQYKINFENGNWDMYYNGDLLGYFPESLWSGSFTQAGLIQAFAEVETTGTTCIQMGNGTLGTSAGSAQISNFSLLGSTAAPTLNPYVTDSSPYNYGSATATSMNIGGPGIC